MIKETVEKTMDRFYLATSLNRGIMGNYHKDGVKILFTSF